MKSVVKIIWFIGFSLLPVCAFAQWTSTYETGHDNRIGIGAHVSHARINDSEMTINGLSVDYEFDDVPGFGINLVMSLNEFLSLEFCIDSMSKSDAHINIADQKTKIGEFSTIPVTFGAKFHLPTDTIFRPYFGMGIGYYFNEFDRADNPLMPGSMAIDDAFGFHYSFGTDLWINRVENTAMNFDIKYLKPDTENDSIDWDAWNFGIGITYYFQ